MSEAATGKSYVSALTPARDLELIPYPHEISYRGAPWRAPPSLYLHLPSESYPGVRAKSQALAQQFTAGGIRAQLSSTTLVKGYQAVVSSSPTVGKQWGELVRPLRGVCGKPEGYRVTVTEEGAFIQADDEQGLYYGGQTLRQLLESSREVPGMIVEDGPLLAVRAMHLDLRGWPPTRAYLEKTIERLSQHKYNLVILEYERHFSYNSQPGVPAAEALPPNYIAELNLFAQDRGVTLVPLIHCLGHAGHFLRLEPYREIREDPRYFEQVCPSNPQSLEVFSAMAEDLLVAHPGRYVHIGGDGARFLGACPKCQARARKLGGRTALYLEYIGKVAMYLIGRGRTVLVWDEVLRNATDDQLRWLPAEVVVVFCHYAPQEGRATPDILVPLDRYKKLGRRCWGAASRLPTERQVAFDNLDAWLEAAEMGYLEGLVTTTWTREGSLGALLAPPEIAWPGALYAAERGWSGRERSAREEFFRRFGACFFGFRENADRERLWAVFDLFLRNHPREAREYLQQVESRCTRNQETLALFDSWLALATFQLYAERFQAAVGANYRNLRGGEGDPFHAGRLRWRIEDLRGKAGELMRVFRERAGLLSPLSSAEEYLNNNFAYHLARLEELSAILAKYPLPEQPWQQPVRL